MKCNYNIEWVVLMTNLWKFRVERSIGTSKKNAREFNHPDMFKSFKNEILMDFPFLGFLFFNVLFKKAGFLETFQWYWTSCTKSNSIWSEIHSTGLDFLRDIKGWMEMFSEKVKWILKPCRDVCWWNPGIWYMPDLSQVSTPTDRRLSNFPEMFRPLAFQYDQI